MPLISSDQEQCVTHTAHTIPISLTHSPCGSFNTCAKGEQPHYLNRGWGGQACVDEMKNIMSGNHPIDIAWADEVRDTPL
jgi:hypothetical protein